MYDVFNAIAELSQKELALPPWMYFDYDLQSILIEDL